MNALMSDASMRKVAVDLEPETAKALGIPTVSPAILRDLERKAGEPAQGVEPEPELAPAGGPTEPMDVDMPAQVDEIPAGDEEVAEPELPSRTTHGKLFTDKSAHPLQLLDTLSMRYGTEWAEWESDTLWWALRKDFGPVGEITRNKIMALRTAVTSDLPWLDWDVFEDSGLSWNDTIPVIGTFQPMSPRQMAFTVQILKAIRSDEAFENEVKAYISALLEEDGWVYAPEEYFDGAQELLDRRVWLVGFKQEVAMAWDRIRDVDPTTIQWRNDNPLDIHLLKLMVVKRYIDGRNTNRATVPGAPTNSSTASPPVP
jgi:hypothetical protein